MSFEEIKGILEEQGKAFQQWKGDLQALKGDVLSIMKRANRPSPSGEQTVGDPEYTKAFNSFLRKGDASDLERKGMSMDSDPDGGYAVPEELDVEIESFALSTVVMRQIAKVKTARSANYSRLVNLHGTESGWVGEQQERPATQGPKLAKIMPPYGELYANPQITQALLDDAAFDIGEWLTTEISEAFTEQEGAAFILGNGVNKPRGLLAHPITNEADSVRALGTLRYVASGKAGSFADTAPADVLVTLVKDLKPAYRNGAVWLMNSTTAATISKFKDGQGQYLWQRSIIDGQPDRLLGYPVYEDDNMPDIADNSYSVAFGNFKRGYQIVDRNTRILRDPYTNKPHVGFYATKRVSGELVNSEAIRLIKFAAA